MSSYANLEDVKRQLAISDAEPDDAAAIARVAQLDVEMSRLLELKCGDRKWGGTAAAAARTVDGPFGGDGTVLLLPTPVRSVTAVATTGDLVETLDAEDWVLWLPSVNGEYRALKRIDGGLWPRRDGRTRISVTAVWADTAPGGTVPTEVTEAVTWLVVEEFRLQESSPAGEIGPEGMTVRPRNPWNFQIVQTVVDRYKTAAPVPSF